MTGATAPDVSVVVVSHNDAERLPRAIRSIQSQTLQSLEIIVVDDGSTDGTADIVLAIAEADPRIRFARLSANSGSASAPRNHGLDLAGAPWVMFCDSDDEYERDACKVLLDAAETTGSDIVCGTAVRVNVHTGRVKRWRPDLHERMQVVDRLGDLPELLYDTISVNKIYRRELLLERGVRFPEGLLFEDQLFTLEAMAAARRLAVIPDTVYRWYVDRLSDDPSITQRRREARNVESRIEINRRIDDFLAAHPDPRLRREKDLKFFRHDLYLYLSTMLDVDDETASVLMDRLVPYVSVVDVTSAWEVRPGLRIAIYHLLQHDLEGVRAAMRHLRWAGVVDRPVVAVDGRELWDCSHRVGGPPAGGFAADVWLDVTELGLLDKPFPERRYLHRVESIEVVGPRVVVHGSSVDYDGALGGAEEISLQWRSRSGRRASTLACRWTGEDGARRRWSADGVVSGGARAPRPGDRGPLVLAVRSGGQTNRTAVRVENPSALREEIPGGNGVRLRLSPSIRNSVVWRVVGSPVPAGRLVRAWARLRTGMRRRFG
jgi:CDP-glycerol glycerophosphotransferase